MANLQTQSLRYAYNVQRTQTKFPKMLQFESVF